MSEPPDHFSPSSWKDWDQCQLAWYYKRIAKLPDPSGPDAVVGTVSHRALQHLMDAPPVERTLGLARTCAADAWAETGDPTVSKRAVWAAVAGLWTVEDPTEVDVAATEQRIEWDMLGVPMVAIVDRAVNSTFGVRPDDYKSGRFKADRQHFPRRQITVCASALASVHGTVNVDPTGGDLLYTTAGVVERAPTDPDTVRAVEVEGAKAWLDVKHACALDRFQANPTPLCGWCPFAGQCRAGENIITVARANGWGWYSPDLPGVRQVERAQEERAWAA